MCGMKFYADRPSRRTRQIVGDLFFIAWVYVWVQTGLSIRSATLALGSPGEQIDESATGLARWLHDAGSRAGDIPLLGDRLATPFRGAGDAATQLAAAGQAQVEAVHSLAMWLGIAVALVPIALVALVYVPLRARFVRRATAGARFMDSADDLDLFALRAMANQPLHVLARISPDPAGAWRSGDREVIARLAQVELADSGLRMPTRG